MPALRPEERTYRDYEGSPEQINGAPSTDDQKFKAEEREHRDAVLVDHANLLDRIEGVFSRLSDFIAVFDAAFYGAARDVENTEFTQVFDDAYQGNTE